MKKASVPVPRPVSRLEDIELEVEAEGREWTRQRLQERLQQLADEHGEVFPPQRPAPAKSPAPAQDPAQPARTD